ncbi:hypothetical protein [Halococcoides cellulosivorans]|uniref:hypothetical protein n=1 Tax=Halococcoides cellulosivorans TaxID=1679096 RepID=UPI00131F097C|nr:hypothetical protein [Halococcoides cellulosivorans]
MASRDPDELREELESVEFATNEQTLAELRSEARETVNAQINTLDDIDTKASKILRLNIVLIGILVSGLSIIAQFGNGPNFPEISNFLNGYVTLGTVSIVLSTAFAAMTYTASEQDIGLSHENLSALLQADLDRSEAETLMLKNYIVRINFNRSTNVRNIPLIQLTILFAVIAVVSFVLGVHEALVGPVPGLYVFGTLLVILTVVAVSGVVKQIYRAIRDYIEWR